ncbi:MAG: M61 family peptidase [Deltaproteobacteria bacterium]|nr:M61 family peptidase [Deltaproteobacteria bacterium]
MFHLKNFFTIALLCLCCVTPVNAGEIPAPQDIAYPGTLSLSVDLTDLERRLFTVRESVPVKPGPLTLLYPQWLPGTHGPSGPVNLLTGLIVTTRGRRLPWLRDPINMYAFHIEVPADADRIDLEFQFASPQTSEQGRIVATPEILGLQWNTVVLYPAGYYASRIAVKADVKLPAGWQFATALDVASRRAERVEFAPTALDMLVDSPLFAGRHYQRVDLDPGADVPVHLNMVADNPSRLEIKPEQLAAYRKLMKEAYALYGTRAFDRYDFLLALTENFSGIGLEHHRSSENVHRPGHFTEWEKNAPGRDLLAHELTHSWNGKQRRPADLWTANFNVPMQDSLLWVYEGQTQFWGIVLSARSGLWSPQVAKDVLANIAAVHDRNRPGRVWRNLQDTTNQPILGGRSLPFPSWQRTVDYYNEGVLLWLDVDTKLRELTRDQRSLDDFARAFFGTKDKSYDVVTYTFDDVSAALNTVSPYDWKAFLKERLDGHGPAAPLDGLKRSGWQLIYREEQSAYLKSADERSRSINLGFSLGLVVSTRDKGKVTEVLWDSPAFKAGLTTAATLIAVNGQEFTPELLLDAIRAAKGANQPIELLVKTFDRYRTVRLPYFEGLRYPTLERIDGADDQLTAILKPRT